MPVFSYVAVDSTGKEITGQIEAPSSEEAIKRLRQRGVFPTKVEEKQTRVAAAAKRKGKTAAFGKVSQKQLTAFTRQLSILLSAGIPLVRCLKTLEGQLKPGVLKNALIDVADDVEGGSSLSEAMQKHPKVFDRLYVNMVKAGEAGGVLEPILERLATFMEKAQKIKKQVISALVYPAVVIFFAFVIVTVIMLVVVPKFKKMFTEMGMELPAPTTLLFGIATVLLNNWFLIPAIPIGLIVVIKLVGMNPQGRYLIDLAKFKFPLFGIIVRKAAVSRFARTLGTLITSGVPILDALNIIRDATGNAVLARAVGSVHSSIKEGESIAGPLRNSGVFDDMVITMVEVGEETGELDRMLLKVADVYDDDVDAAISGLMSILEPVLIIGLGGTIGFIVISLYLPLISMINAMSQQ